jgi:hypothetical protein
MNKAQKKLIGFCLTLTSAIACLATVQPARAAEPMYEGKALSEWLIALHVGPTDEEVVAATQQNVDPAKLVEQKKSRAQEAVRQIGTNGLPTLLDIISVEQWDREKVLGKLKSKDFQKAAGNKNVPTKVFREMAADCFGILGTNADPAIPELKRLLYASPECRPEVASALVKIGPNGFTVLTNAMNDSDMASVLVKTIGQQGGSDVKTITRILIGALNNNDSLVSEYAAVYLAGKDAELAIPALISFLDNHDYPGQYVFLALASYGPKAQNAVPKLWSLYTNKPDVFVMDALKAIDRETAGRAEEFLVNSGPLNEARRDYSRTKLTNGLELIAGGVIDTGIITLTNHWLSTAQLLNTNTGKWTETGRMITARDGHKALLLRDGRVFIAGGYGAPPIPGRFPSILSSAELYDPATGTWTGAGTMKFARVWPKVTLRRDGKVLVSGGWNHGNLSSEELYDPATGTWIVVTNK